MSPKRISRPSVCGARPKPQAAVPSWNIKGLPLLSVSGIASSEKGT